MPGTTVGSISCSSGLLVILRSSLGLSHMNQEWGSWMMLHGHWLNFFMRAWGPLGNVWDIPSWGCFWGCPSVESVLTCLVRAVGLSGPVVALPWGSLVWRGDQLFLSGLVPRKCILSLVTPLSQAYISLWHIVLAVLFLAPFETSILFVVVVNTP